MMKNLGKILATAAVAVILVLAIVGSVLVATDSRGRPLDRHQRDKSLIQGRAISAGMPRTL